MVDGASATRATTPAVLSGREGGGGRQSADAVLPGQEGSGVRLQKGSDNQHVVGGGGACDKARGWGEARRPPRPPS